MRIAMVTQSYYPRLGGVTEHVHCLSKALRSLGHQVTVITSGPPADVEDSTVRIGRNALFPINGAMVNVTVGFNLGKRLRKEFSNGVFDVIHIQCPLEPTLPLAALAAARSIALPVVGTFHMAARVSRAYEVFSPVLLKQASRLDARIAVSRTAERFALRYFPGEYAVIPNGVDLSRFTNKTEQVGELMDGKINILFVGRLDVRKQVPWLVSSFKKLYSRNRNCRLIIIGKGLTEPACRIAAFPLVGKSVFFKGSVLPEDLPQYYNSTHVFCSVPSGSESFGIVLLEAMAAGKPVVATDIDGYREAVTDGGEGILVRPGDTAALVEAMERLVEDRELRLAMGTRGHRKASQFDWSQVARNVEDIYARLVSKLPAE
jgi:phosphatidylinositol alpha-mannosyltransferase